MSPQSIGVVMNGVTGPHGLPPAPGPLDPRDPRAGRRALPDGEQGPARSRSWSAAAPRSCRGSPSGTASSPGPPTSTRRSPTTRNRSTSTPRSPRPARRPCSRRSRRASTSTPRSRPPRRRGRAGRWPRPRPPGRRQARRRAGQALPARPAQAAAPDRRRLLRPDPVGARRVRLLGLRGRLAGRAAPVVELPRRGRRRHRPRHVPALGVRAGEPVRPGRPRSPRRPSPTSPSAVDEQGEPYEATADDAAYGIFELEGGIDRADQLLLGVRVNRDELVEFQVDGTHGSAVAGLRDCRVQHRAATPKPVWNPDLPATARFRDGWQEVPDNDGVRQRLQGPVGAVPPPRRRGRAAPLRPRLGRARRAARRAGPALLRRGPPPRAGGALMTTAERSRCPAGSTRLREPVSLGRARAVPPRSRVAYAAAHVVADPRGDNAPGAPAAVDWDATLRFRHHLWSHGLGVAEAMDTAQRGMGLDWAATRELIRRSAAEAKALATRRRGSPAARAPTRPRHAPRPWTRSGGLRGAARDRRGRGRRGHRDGRAGSWPRRARPRGLPPRSTASCSPEADRPVILHWLGQMFDPALAGYWGSRDVPRPPRRSSP